MCVFQMLAYLKARERERQAGKIFDIFDEDSAYSSNIRQMRARLDEDSTKIRHVRQRFDKESASVRRRFDEHPTHMNKTMRFDIVVYASRLGASVVSCSVCVSNACILVGKGKGKASRPKSGKNKASEAKGVMASQTE